MKSIAGTLKLDLAAYRELEAFAQLGTELDPVTQRQLDRGARLVELLKQPQYSPVPVEQQVISIYAATKGYLDDVPLSRVREFEIKLLTHIDQRHNDIRTTIRDKKVIDKDLEPQLKVAVEGFKNTAWTK